MLWCKTVIELNYFTSKCSMSPCSTRDPPGPICHLLNLFLFWLFKMNEHFLIIRQKQNNIFWPVHFLHVAVDLLNIDLFFPKKNIGLNCKERRPTFFFPNLYLNCKERRPIFFFFPNLYLKGVQTNMRPDFCEKKISRINGNALIKRSPS